MPSLQRNKRSVPARDSIPAATATAIASSASASAPAAVSHVQSPQAPASKAVFGTQKLLQPPASVVEAEVDAKVVAEAAVEYDEMQVLRSQTPQHLLQRQLAHAYMDLADAKQETERAHAALAIARAASVSDVSSPSKATALTPATPIKSTKSTASDFSPSPSSSSSSSHALGVSRVFLGARNLERDEDGQLWMDVTDLPYHSQFQSQSQSKSKSVPRLQTFPAVESVAEQTRAAAAVATTVHRDLASTIPTTSWITLAIIILHGILLIHFWMKTNRLETRMENALDKLHLIVGKLETRVEQRPSRDLGDKGAGVGLGLGIDVVGAGAAGSASDIA